MENHIIVSEWLLRDVQVDFYLPRHVSGPLSLVLINDGQSMKEMYFGSLLEDLYMQKAIQPLFCVAIHAGPERRMEYGIAAQPDYLGRGAKATEYSRFILRELLPFIDKTFSLDQFAEKAFAGFSLGGLSAMDIVWNHPGIFKKTGVFSGSFWWRSLDQDDPAYEDDQHRIMQQQIRQGPYHPGLKFFLQCGNKDETRDRNNNGIIDSIDDTLDILKELQLKGYDKEKDLYYLEMPEGAHDIPTWAQAMPEFLKWGWGRDFKSYW
ncbi:MAG TPA: alpha/beta hydrolase-fold protein [Chitinophagaceae bacterium]|nr:alpha/beta hydrolase-fold protein [Chitinophagaceae bacterium]